MLRVARKFGLTEPDDLDMDTTVQEAGITHPTEMKLMSHLMKRLMALHGRLKDVCGNGIAGVKALSNQFKECLTHYRFFAKDSATKQELIRRAVALSSAGLTALGQYLPGGRAFDKLQGRYQEEILRLSSLGPELMDQIVYWLDTSKVAKDKIVSLWKMVPKAIPKGKIGKSVEFGRKWIINCYRGGYMLVMAPENPKISDQHCVIESLSLHRTVFEEMPKTYGTDRGMWSAENLELCLSAGIDGKKLSMPISRPLPSIAKGLHELRLSGRGGELRVFYAIRVGDAIYVIHATQKKSQGLDKKTIEVLKDRLRSVPV